MKRIVYSWRAVIWRRSGMAVAGLLLATFVGALAFSAKNPIVGRFDVVQAQLYELLDEEGNLRAKLESSEGASTLSLFDRRGLPRITLQTDDDETTIHLMNEKGGGAFIIHQHPVVGTVLLARDQTGKTRWHIHASTIESSFVLYDANREKRYVVSQHHRGEVWTQMIDSEGKSIWEVGKPDQQDADSRRIIKQKPLGPP